MAMKLLKVALLVYVALCIAEEVEEEQVLQIPAIKNVEKFFFLETFQNGGSAINPTDFGWILSTKEEYKAQVPEILSVDSAFDKDKYMTLNKKHVRYGLSKKLDKPVSLGEDEIVVQFEARFANKLTCSGAYIKFVADTVEESQEDFSEQTPYVIMFGPDKCGNNQKLHTIFRHQNPNTGEFEEKHMQGVGSFTNDDTTHVYTLHISKNDQTVKVFVDREEKGSGSVLESSAFFPSFSPDEEIDDPEDSKPEDWVDNPKMVDPEAKKPEDWIDEKLIPDTKAKKPDDWNDEEDGEWEPSMIDNPEYKGEWKAPMIDNPDYKGAWTPRKIKNPDYFKQEEPLSNLPKISHVFIEVLANDDDISFDNIIITNDPESAELLATNHGIAKRDIEKKRTAAQKNSQRKKERDRKLAEEFGATAVLEYISGEFQDFYELYPIPTTIGLASLVLVFVYLVLLRSPSERPRSNPEPSNDKPTEDDKPEEVEDENENENDAPSEENEESEEKTTKKSGVRRRPRRAD